MIDSNVIKALFTLLRSGLWEKEVDDLNCFPLEDKEWEVLYNIAVAQTIEGLVYDGVQKLPKAFFPSKNILLQLVVRLNKIETDNKKMNSCIYEQVLFFDKLEVSPILLKGQGIGQYYPNSNHRICGDIDWYFDSIDEKNKVEDKLKSKNFRISYPTADSCNYIWRTCEVEHHSKLFDVFNPVARRKLERIKGDFLVERNIVDRGGYNVQVLPANLNIIQVNLHILKHLLSFGIGLRQICDSATLYDKLDGKYNKQWLFDVYKEIGIVNWIYVLHDLLVKYVGLSESKLPFQNKGNLSSDWMLTDILSTGNFGFFDSKFTLIRKDKTIERKNKPGRLWYAFQRYFPLAPYEALSFPVVHFVDRFKSLTVG